MSVKLLGGRHPWLALLLTVTVALVIARANTAIAQELPNPDAPAAAEAAPEAGAAAGAQSADGGQPDVGLFYIHPLWLLLLTVAVCFWFYVTSWVSSDAKGVGMDYPMMGASMIGAGFIGMLLALLVHAAFAFLSIVLVIAAFSVYITYRNKLVPEQHKFLGAHHRAELCARIPIINKIAAFQPTVRVRGTGLPLTGKDGQLLDDVTAEQPSLTQAADIITDLILRAGITSSPKVRLQPSADQYIAQFLMDGIVQNVEAFDAELSQKILGCMSQFAGLTKQGRLRQGQSHIYAELPGRGKTEIGVQIVAAGGKPALVLNFPDWTADLYKSGMEALGMHDAIVKRLKVALNQKRSTVLFCSDPGMGKTTTLYAATSAIDIFTTDVFAVEKKEEHDLDQIRRMAIPADQPFDLFFQALLREAPHAIMFGEIENAEHARSLLKFAADEGQVLTTLKSPDAPNGLAALSKLVGEPELVTGSVTCILGQKLVRKLCTNCREEVEPNPALLAKLGLDPGQPGTWHRPVGCDACLNSGYRGRIGIFSMLIVTDPVKQALRQGDVSAAAIRQAAGKTAFRTMYQDGVSKVAAGVTTIEEIRRVLQPK